MQGGNVVLQQSSPFVQATPAPLPSPGWPLEELLLDKLLEKFTSRGRDFSVDRRARGAQQQLTVGSPDLKLPSKERKVVSCLLHTQSANLTSASSKDPLSSHPHIFLHS